MKDILSILPGWLLAIALISLFILAFYGMRKGYTIRLWPPRFSAPDNRTLVQSAATTNAELLTSIVNNALETVCRAVCIPSSPRETTVRAFIFEKIGNELVCTHFWAENPSKEEVNVTRFLVNEQVAENVVVVRAFLRASIQRSPVQPNPDGLRGDINKDLVYVLACPIYSKNDKGDKILWGAVDFDAGKDVGVRLLESDIADEVMVCLAREIGLVLSTR